MICAFTRVLPGDVLSVVIVGQPTRRRATFGISRYMGEILRHFSKDTSAVYFWPLSTAEGDPRGANSQLLSHSHESLLMLQYVHSFFFGCFPSTTRVDTDLSIGVHYTHRCKMVDELSLSSSDKKRSACRPSDCITFPSSGHSCVHTSCLTAGSPSLP